MAETHHQKVYRVKAHTVCLISHVDMLMRLCMYMPLHSVKSVTVEMTLFAAKRAAFMRGVLIGQSHSVAYWLCVDNAWTMAAQRYALSSDRRLLFIISNS